MRLGFTILFICVVASLKAQYNIGFKIDNYDSDTLVIGYYMMDKQLVYDSLYAEEKGKFTLKTDEDIPQGVYLALFQPDQTFMQFLINDREKDFRVILDFDDLSKIKFKGSKDNKVFQEYVDFLGKVRPEAELLKDTIGKLRTTTDDVSEFEQALELIDAKVEAKQKAIIESEDNPIASLLVKANLPFEAKDFDDYENPAMARYLWYKKHYFDNIEMDNPASLRTPFLFERINYYLTKLTPNHPDSIAISLDTILNMLDPQPENYKYYLSHFLNDYASSKIVGYDAIYVHLVDNYYAQGRAPWIDEENLARLIDNANKIRPVLIGKIAEDITVYDEQNNPITLSEIDYEYLVLLFWSPDCPHCKKTMPYFIEFDKKWRDKGVRTFAICSKHKDKVNDCWEYVKEKDMLGFINGADKYHRSRFKIKYNVQSTPKIFILNKDREILMKNVGGEQLEKVMEEILRIEHTNR
ncbi:MAG: redoxin family protein [Saprospiraceae bacterium]|nr:redoxin family protein [Saprospiraceae bacterium]